MSGKRIDVESLIGRKFNNLTIVGDRRQNKHCQLELFVRCDCGISKFVQYAEIKSGKTKSCGCLKGKIAAQRMTTHGLRRHPLYRIWSHLKDRCYNSNTEHFSYYGGRGIKVCQEWLSDFMSFYDFSIKNGWEIGLEIDRENNDGDYSPENCRFISRSENMNNTRLIQIDNTSGYRGVYYKTREKYFIASVQIKNHEMEKGGFHTAKEAAIFRDSFVIKNNIKTPLNFPETKVLL